MANAKPMKRLARPLTLGLALWCGLNAGCVEMNAFVAPDGPPGAGAPAAVTPGTVVSPHQVVALWQDRVMWTPDTVHNGQPTPALAGRLYLFNQNLSAMLAGDGAVEVDLYDDTPVEQYQPSVLLERWQIDAATLQRLWRKDRFGPGYTLLLPWTTLKDHPEIMKIHLVVKYTPKGGSPLFYPGSLMAVNFGEVPSGFVFNQSPANQPVQPATAQAPAATGLPPAVMPPPQVQQAGYQQPAYQPQTVMSVQPAPSSVMPPPPGAAAPANPLPAMVDNMVSHVPVSRPEEPRPLPLRVRIGVPQNERD
jgi:hypothetical protein